jgi:hypothetical protein
MDNEKEGEHRMDTEPNNANADPNTADDLRSVIRGVIDEYVSTEHRRAEPVYKTELADERRRREQLERRVNELVAENERSRKTAEKAERESAIRSELQRLGVAKLDLAFRAVKDDIQRSDDGRIVARSGEGEHGLREYLAQFVAENPELLPARISGGSGMEAGSKSHLNSGGIDLDKIRPGMNPEELERARQEIARLASQALKGL